MGELLRGGGFDGADDVKSVYSYDPTTKAWTKQADMSVTREAPVSAWLGGKLYVTGGWGADADPTGVAGSAATMVTSSAWRGSVSWNSSTKIRR